MLFQCHEPDAQIVYLAGDFNAWANSKEGVITDKQFAMEGPDKEGIWRKVVKLAPGRHLFRFNREGDSKGWITPGMFTTRDSDDNAVLIVTPEGDVQLDSSVIAE